MAVRPATAADLPDLVALDAELFGVDAWSTASWAEEVTSGRRRVALAVNDAGRLMGYVVTTGPDEVVDLLRIGVRRDRQRSGLGGLLLTGAIDAARDTGADRMMLEVGELNDAALALYRLHGFTPVDRRRVYYRDGSDALVLLRPLGEEVSR